MADMNYVSPLTSDLTDYYTKSEVDELQQGDAATYATSAEIVAGDNAVKGWVASQGYLTEHQDLTNYATKDYVAAAVEDIEVGGGVRIEVVATLPAHPEENVIYLTRKSESDTDNIYNEWIWVADTESYELIGDTSSGVIPDLTDYATKQWVEAKGYLTAVAARDVAYDNSTSGLLADTVQNAINEVNDKVEAIDVPDVSGFATESFVDAGINNAINNLAGTLSTVATSGSYNDLTDKPVIPAAPDLSSYATKAELSAKANAADLAAVATTGSYNDLTNKPAIPTVPANVSAFTNDAGYLTAHQDISGKANTADLATVAFSGDYDDLSNKPSIPSTSGLASESYVDNAIAGINIPDVSDFITAEDLPDLSGYAETANLASVATSGSYNDLTDKPTIPSVSGLATETYVDNAVAAITVPTSLSDLDNDMNFVDEAMAKAAAIDEINNNVSAAGLSGDYDDLTNKPTIPSLSGYATETWVGQQGYLIQHQDISGKANSSDLATVATSGDYDDLTNKPTIPVLPTLATVATSGSYNDLLNKPEIDGFDELIRTVFFLKSSSNVGLAERTAQTKDELIDFYNKGYIVNFISALLPLTLTLSDLGCQEQQISITEIKGINNSYGYTIQNDASSSGIELQAGSYLLKISNNGLYVFIPKSGQTVVDLFRYVFKAKLYHYSNITSGLTANTIQDAIDELAASIPVMPTLATVATSGDYDDLINKPTLFSGDYNDLRNKPTIPSGGGGSVGWSYDSRTGYMTFTGMSDDNL